MKAIERITGVTTSHAADRGWSGGAETADMSVRGWGGMGRGLAGRRVGELGLLWGVSM